MDSDHTDYLLSPTEIDRRHVAYTRLALSISVGAVLTSLDLLVAHPLASSGLLLVLFVILLLSRTLFAKSFVRYSTTVWRFGGDTLTRHNGPVIDEHRLDEIDRVQVKKTVTGARVLTTVLQREQDARRQVD